MVRHIRGEVTTVRREPEGSWMLWVCLEKEESEAECGGVGPWIAAGGINAGRGGSEGKGGTQRRKKRRRWWRMGSKRQATDAAEVAEVRLP